MIRDVDLVAYLPPVIAGFNEINITLTAENPEFILIWETMDRVLKNEFIATADEYGLKRFEKFLNIYPMADETLEIRRARVQAGWFTDLPYTWRILLQKISEICGANYPIIVTQDCYIIRLEIGVELQWQIESLINVIEKMLPCNMGIAIKNVLPIDLEMSAPTIRPDWFDYRIEYRGEINVDENILLIRAVCMHVLIPFWGDGTYNGRRRYNGTMRYNAKRNYELRVNMKNVLQLYTEQAIRYAIVFGGHIQYKFDAGMLMIFYYCSKLSEMIHTSTAIHTGLRSPSGDVGNMSIETKRNVVRYGGTRRYNGTIEYNALYRKEQVE